MKVNERVVSLTVRAKTFDNAILLLCYGQKILRNNDEITGAEIVEGLKQSGQLEGRTDRILDRLGSDGNVIITGEHRGKKYRITNQGLRNARQLAADLLATIA
jgi:DNA-binding PadR family transcriptional regulator